MDDKLLTIIIPVYNEEKTIEKILDKVYLTFESQISHIQIIVVEDGSTDSTKKLLIQNKYKTQNNFLFLYHEKNKGKGSAIKTALSYAIGKYTIIQDADLEYDPQDIKKLLDYAQQNDSIAVYGSRNLRKENKHGKPMFYLGGKGITWLTNLLFPGAHLTDEPTCYKLIKTETLKILPLTNTRFEFCPQVTGWLLKMGGEIHEMPISYNPRTKKDGKKISWYDGVLALKELLFIRLSLLSSITTAITITALCFFIYLLVWGGHFMGYEDKTAEAAINLTHGVIKIHKAGIGAVLLYVPFVLIGKIFVSAHKIMKFLTIVPVFYSVVTIGFLYLSLFKLTQKKILSILVSLIIAIGSVWLPYSNIGMEYQTGLLLAILLFTLLKWREEKISIFVVGLIILFLTITKSYGIIFLIPTVVFIGLVLKQKNKSLSRLVVWLKFLMPVFAGVLIFCLINFISFGKFTGAYKLGTEFDILYWWEGFYGIFFSFGKSIFLYSPMLILAAFYWPRFYQKDNYVALFILLSSAILLLITAPFSYWSDETLSVRKLVPIIPLLHFPLVLFFETTNKKILLNLIFTVLLISSIYFQFINSSYAYWESLKVTRSGNADTLGMLRYQPQLSHVYIHHKFFLSYLSSVFSDKNDNKFIYSEKSWMRSWPDPQLKDAIIFNVNIDIERLRRPNTFLWRIKNENNRKIFLLFEAIGLLITGTILLVNTRQTTNHL